MLHVFLLIGSLLSAPERTIEQVLFDECNLPEAAQMAPTTPTDYALKFFLLKRFTRDLDSAVGYLLSAPTHDPIVTLLISRISGAEDTLFKMGNRPHIQLCAQVSEPISQKYFENPYEFSEPELLSLQGHTDVQDVVTTVWTLEPRVVERFFYFLARRQIYIKNVIKELEFLCKNRIPLAFGALGDAYFYGLGVPKDMDRALEYYWAGRDLGSARCYVGVGRVLMTDAQGDLEGAETAIDIATMHDDNAEALYCKYLLSMIKQQGKEESETTSAINYLHSAATKGYLPAVFDFTMIQAGTSDLSATPYALISFKSITQYHPILIELEKKAMNAYSSKNYLQAVLYYLFMAEFKVDFALRNVAFILENHQVFDERKKIVDEIESLTKDELLLRVYLELSGRHRKYYKSVGDCYFYGKGAPVSKEKALAYYLSAMEYSNEAAYNVAYMYETGQGVPRDLFRAYKYVSRGIVGSRCYLVIFYAKLRILLRILIAGYRKWLITGAALLIASMALTRLRSK